MGILSGIFKSRDKPQNAHLVAHTDSLSAAVPGARMSMSIGFVIKEVWMVSLTLKKM